MANLVLNRALGRGTEWVERVNANDPANSVIVIGVLATSGIEADSVLKDKDTLADLVSGATNEVTNTGYARKVLDQAGGLVVTYDDTSDRVDVDCPDQTWTAVAAGDGWNDVFFAYDSDSTGGTDANIVPWLVLDFVVVPDGSDLTMQVGASGFFRAS